MESITEFVGESTRWHYKGGVLNGFTCIKVVLYPRDEFPSKIYFKLLKKLSETNEEQCEIWLKLDMRDIARELTQLIESKVSQILS